MTDAGGPPPISYAKSGGVHIAYVVAGGGPLDIVIVPGYASNLEVSGESPGIRRILERLTRIGRVIGFDKRGTGLSDPVADVPTLEQRMDDVRAVMDAAGSERAALIGISEGAPMSILFAATYPQRTTHLVLVGGMARSTWAPDYPFAAPREALEEAANLFTIPSFGTGENLEVFAPSVAGDRQVREGWARLERASASPGMFRKLVEMFLDVDVRPALPLVQAPTLVLHRIGDRVVPLAAGRWMAQQIRGARLVELPGRDHLLWAGDHDTPLGEIEEFLTGSRARTEDDFDRVLATVLFTDLVGSTEHAALLGDREWHALLERYYAAVREQLERFRGREIKTIGDGFLASFDGPARAVRAAQSICAEVAKLGLELRAGLHTGELTVSGSDVAGIAVHIGARIVALAGPGEVLVSSTVKDLVAGSGIEFSDRGNHALKGVPGEWAVFRVER